MDNSEDYVKAYINSKEYLIEEYPSLFRKFALEIVFDKQELVLNTVHNILQSGKRKGGRMLDFGCGPSATKIASASRYYKEIIMADYSTYSRQEIKKWLKEEEGYLDWKPLYEVVAKLEGHSDIDGGTKEIEKRIRSRVKEVIHCDILADPPIPEQYGKFDLVFTSFCFELVCVNPEMFKNCVKKLSSLIRDGGTFIMCVVLRATSYTLNNKLISIFPVTEGLIKESLDNCGLVINTWYLSDNETNYDYCNYSGMAIFSAEKNIKI